MGADVWLLLNEALFSTKFSAGSELVELSSNFRRADLVTAWLKSSTLLCANC